MTSVNLIINRWSVHVPSVARARIMPTLFLRKPLIYIDCHNGRDMEIKYPIGGWEAATKDFQALQTEMTRVQKVLGTLPVKAISTSDNNDSDSEPDSPKSESSYLKSTY